MAMTEIRYDRGLERERERGRGSKERGNEEGTDDGMDQGEEGSEKGPLVGGGKRDRGGSCIDRAALQGFIPSPRSAPTTQLSGTSTILLGGELWRNILVISLFLAQPRDSFYVFPLPLPLSFRSFFPFFFPPSVFHSPPFCLCYLFFPFLRVPLPKLASRFVFFFSLLFIVLHFFLQFSRLFSIQVFARRR